MSDHQPHPVCQGKRCVKEKSNDPRESALSVKAKQRKLNHLRLFVKRKKQNCERELTFLPFTVAAAAGFLFCIGVSTMTLLGESESVLIGDDISRFPSSSSFSSSCLFVLSCCKWLLASTICVTHLLGRSPSLLCGIGFSSSSESSIIPSKSFLLRVVLDRLLCCCSSSAIDMGGNLGGTRPVCSIFGWLSCRSVKVKYLQFNTHVTFHNS